MRLGLDMSVARALTLTNCQVPSVCRLVLQPILGVLPAIVAAFESGFGDAVRAAG